MWQNSFENFLVRNDVEYLKDVLMSGITSMRCGGVASFCVSPGDADELTKVLEYLIGEKIRFKVVGGMTNTLPCDDLFDGALIRTSGFDGISFFDDARVISGAGVPLSHMVRAAAEKGIGGFEELSGIPGTVGGAVFGNSGAHSKNISDVMLSVTALDISLGKVVRLDVSELEYGYRQSKFKRTDNYVIIEAELQGVFGKYGNIFDKIKSLSEIRRQRQPINMPSLGSIFKHPSGDFAPRLIEELSLKGLSCGGAEVSKKHAGFIVNTGNATAEDVLRLIEMIKRRVYEAYSIMLEEEIDVM